MYELYDTEAFPMTRIQTSKAREVFADLIDRVRLNGERIILHRYGKDAAALVPAGDVELLEAIGDQLDVEAARKALKEPGPSIPWEKVKAELDL